MIEVVVGLLVLWVIANCAAPYCALAGAERISPGRLPAELLVWPRDRKVRFYITHCHYGYGFSVWAPFANLVFFDREFFANASPALIRYVVAHEIAHFSFGHHRKRWLCVVTGLILLPQVRKWIEVMEEEADEEAARRTGFPRSAFPEIGG